MDGKSYSVYLWSGVMVLIGAVAFVAGMAIHNQQAVANQAPIPTSIYYCSTGYVSPAYEPCRYLRGERNI